MSTLLELVLFLVGAVVLMFLLKPLRIKIENRINRLFIPEEPQFPDLRGRESRTRR
jgi:hypothetical protein